MGERWNCDYLIRNDILDPWSTTSFVVRKARNSKLCCENMDEVVSKFVNEVNRGWLEEDFGIPTALPLHPYNEVKLSLEGSLDRWCFVCSMSFSFWTDYVPGNVPYRVKDPFGRFWVAGSALMVRFNDLIRCGIALSAQSLKEMPFSVFAFLFADLRMATPPMMEERWECIKEVASILDKKFDGKFYNCVLKANGDPMVLLSLVLENFPCYRDVAEYSGHKISFLMKAQMLIVGTSRILREFCDCAALGSCEVFSLSTTYRDIQIMRFYGFLKSSENVESRLTNEELFRFGEPDEVEMRAVANRCLQVLTLRANEMLKITGKGVKITFVDMDYLIHRDRLENSALQFWKSSFPRVRCLFY
uniref:Queuosine 5'-phosphate N-glycosylase/hydrolase n=1 Tax=Trichuris muris TaxID=70415 RepID=A0A5S6QET9_TRIMR